MQRGNTVGGKKPYSRYITMSRNIDKSNSTLVRFQEEQVAKSTGQKDYSKYKRPQSHRQINSVQSIKDALQWRLQLMNEFNIIYTRLLDPMTDEIQLREINDSLNQLLKELKMWDWHIKNKLQRGSSGNSLSSRNSKQFLLQQKSAKEILGKKYFGRAIELPEIRDTLDKQQARKFNLERTVNMKNIPSHKQNKLYKEYTNEIIPENDNLSKFEDNWTPILQSIYKINEGETKNEEAITVLPIPTQKEMETWLVERRKRKLLEQLDL